MDTTEFDIVKVRPEEIIASDDRFALYGEFPSQPISHFQLFSGFQSAYSYWQPDLRLEHYRNIVATFVLERDEEGDLIFSDTAGVSFGVGAEFNAAVGDWFSSVQALLEILRTSHYSLHDQLANQARVLSELFMNEDSRGELKPG